MSRVYDSGLPPNDLSLRARLQRVEDAILSAVKRSGRERSYVTLVAVTKKFSAAVIREGYQLGLRHFGENYVQEFAGKKPELSDLDGAHFHMIGHLQSNKAKTAVVLFDSVDAVDSPRSIERLDRACAEAGRTLNVLLEVKLSTEATKTGVDPAEIPKLLEAGSGCAHVKITGLMTMPPWSEDAEQSRPYFRKLAELARIYHLSELSMGMSNDFEVAIEEGATMIRVGTALFGSRPKPAGAGA
jgi:PLP dependent protein